MSNSSPQFELRKTYRVESARRLPKLDSNHPCSRVHGHSFEITFILVGHLDPQKDWLIDYHELDTLYKPLLNQLDHNYLNDVLALENPTSERIAHWLYTRAVKITPALKQIWVAETPTSLAVFPSLFN